MLEELSKHDKRWRKMAYSLTRNRIAADDLTNDMYIVMNDCGKEFNEINESYVYRVMKSIFLLEKRKKKPDFIGIFKSELNIPDNNEALEDRIQLNDWLTELVWWDREILLHTSERSLSKNEEYIGLKEHVLHYWKGNAMEKLKRIIDGKEND
jgi:DNA-directed RNA polymerase specialized sigma24 family protein